MGHSIYWMEIACYCSEMNILFGFVLAFDFNFRCAFFKALISSPPRNLFPSQNVCRLWVLFSSFILSLLHLSCRAWKLLNNMNLRGDRLRNGHIANDIAKKVWFALCLFALSSRSYETNYHHLDAKCAVHVRTTLFFLCI